MRKGGQIEEENYYMKNPATYHESYQEYALTQMPANEDCQNGDECRGQEYGLSSVSKSTVAGSLA
jgi:hypothetical protein